VYFPVTNYVHGDLEVMRELIEDPHTILDLPAGGRRLVQHVDGYDMTICSGTPIFEKGEETGPGPESWSGRPADRGHLRQALRCLPCFGDTGQWMASKMRQSRSGIVAALSLLLASYCGAHADEVPTSVCASDAQALARFMGT
jgi:hypothetical protein